MIKLFVDAQPIAEERISGIGHMTLELIRALDEHPDNGITFQVILLVASDRLEQVHRWKFKNVAYRKILLPTRLLNLIWKFDLLPPMDIFFGKGVYLFPNYKNWRLTYSKSLTFICDVVFRKFPEVVEPKNLQFLQKNIPRWIERADKILCISKDAQHDVSTYLNVDPQKTAYVPCGVDAALFNKRPDDEVSKFKRDFDLPNDYYLYIGNIEPRKNLLKLIEAYRALSPEIRDRHPLVLVGGGGWKNEAIIEAIEAAQRDGFNIIKVPKYVPDHMLPELYSGAVALVHPALYEGFGISPLQAMACELPVVVASNSSIPEIVGDAGLYVDESNSRDISDKMETIVTDTDLRQEHISRGIIRAKTYSWTHSADLLINEVKRINE